jgi:hypothetical protein
VAPDRFDHRGVQFVHQCPQLVRGTALDRRHLDEWHLDSDRTKALLIPQSSSPGQGQASWSGGSVSSAPLSCITTALGFGEELAAEASTLPADLALSLVVTRQRGFGGKPGVL